MVEGIYTLANDKVFDQLVALLNSIEANAGKKYPVCVIAYDNAVDQVAQEIAKRQNVTLLRDDSFFERWEDFSYEAWQGHPTALDKWSQQGIKGVNRIGMNRRYAAFDIAAPFDRFLYFDADVLVLNSLESLFKQLETSEFVVYDFQYKDPSHIYDINSPKLYEIFPQERVETEIFCAGFYGGRKGLFTVAEREWLAQQLNEGEGEILYPSAPNQSLLNYMKMRLNIPVFNFALELPAEQRTGCSVTSPHFQMKEGKFLLDKAEKLTYLHYIGVSSSVFRRLCAGENIDFPYRDIFLYYRYLNEPENRPRFYGKAYSAKPGEPSLLQKLMKKLGFSK